MPSPKLSMPGSFMSDKAIDEQTLPPKLDLNVGSKSHIFQPPRTPSASTSLYRSTSSLSASNSDLFGSTSRKRTRTDFVQDSGDGLDSRHNEKWKTSNSIGQDSITQSPGPESPAPFVNTRYELSGGLDTPTAAAVAAYERENGDSTYLDTMDRRWAGAKGISDQYSSQMNSGLLPLESNGRARTVFSDQEQLSPSWGKSVFNIVGGVAGKMWQFGTSAFKGFYAGGGAGYQIKTSQPSSTMDQSIWHELPTHSSITNSTPIPGEFPGEDYIPDYMSSPHFERYSAKRVHRDSGAWESNDRWILVPRSASIPYSRDSSPLHTTQVRRTPIASSGGRRPAVRSGRRNLRTSTAGSPALAPNRPTSYASPRSTLSTPTGNNASPVAVEAQRYAARRRREEKEAEASIQKFNAQLKAMIREGKQALGTRFEVDEDEDMEDDMDEIMVKMEDVEDEGIQIDEAYEKRKRRR